MCRSLSHHPACSFFSFVSFLVGVYLFFLSVFIRDMSENSLSGIVVSICFPKCRSKHVIDVIKTTVLPFGNSLWFQLILFVCNTCFAISGNLDPFIRGVPMCFIPHLFARIFGMQVRRPDQQKGSLGKQPVCLKCCKGNSQDFTGNNHHLQTSHDQSSCCPQQQRSVEG